MFLSLKTAFKGAVLAGACVMGFNGTHDENLSQMRENFQETFYAKPLRDHGLDMTNESFAPYENTYKGYRTAAAFPEPHNRYEALNWADERILEGFINSPIRAKGFLLEAFGETLSEEDFNPKTKRLTQDGAIKAYAHICDDKILAVSSASDNITELTTALIAHETNLPTGKGTKHDLACDQLIVREMIKKPEPAPG